MNWSTFIIYLSLSYIVYYALNLLYDLIRSKNETSYERQSSTLFYHETASPHSVLLEEQEAVEPLDIASIAMNEIPQKSTTASNMDLKMITELAKSELQELIKRSE